VDRITDAVNFRFARSLFTKIDLNEKESVTVGGHWVFPPCNDHKDVMLAFAPEAVYVGTLYGGNIKKYRKYPLQ